MDEVISDVLTIAIGIFGILLMIGGVTNNPWQFASRPYRWLFRNIQNMIRNTLQKFLRMLSRILQGLVDLTLSGIIAFCRRFPKTAGTIAVVLILWTIATIALSHAGFP
ncbi:MAG: hypothetical protein Q7J54_06420 [Candidatus Woesearchaeota archaeon]|nr:hypothetical protein [Candidatus Woesearchaeota archaeon]